MAANTKTKAEEQKTLDITRIMSRFRIARFKGTTMYMNDEGYWKPISEDFFRTQAYSILDVPSKNRINEVWDYMQYGTPDLTEYAQYIRMGELVWDTKAVDFTTDISTEDCVYATVYTPQLNPEPSEFVMQVAKGDQSAYDDIMQTIAPIFTHYKPAGVIWWKGRGANGKSTLANLIHKLFPGFISNITLKQIEDERDAPVLNGNLANVIQESSEGYIQDSKAYKSIGTHESFPVHKFHSQQAVVIDGSLHHIYSCNNIPTFADKSDGAKRRTLIIPFEAKFPHDSTFEDRTFTKEFLEQHLGLFLQFAKQLKENGYVYNFNKHTIEIKEKYDNSTDSALTYVEELIDQHIFGFDNYGLLYNDYDNWCSDNGFSVLSRPHLRKVTEDYGFHSTTTKIDDTVYRKYVHNQFTFAELERIGGERLGLHQQIGFKDSLVGIQRPKSSVQELLDAIPD